MFRRLSDSTVAAVSAAGSQSLSFLKLCGRGLLRQTRFQATKCQEPNSHSNSVFGS